jgi:eukaryotic-like serine/threonine-protein kinase
MHEGDSGAQQQLQPRARAAESWGMLGTRYEVYGEIASGGMATVQYGRLIGPRGFARAVAIKRMHPHFAREPDFVSMFVDEARLSARLVHANIIPTLDVVETPGELALVMEYVHGEALSTLLRLAAAEGERVPVRVACALIASVLYGLHAAHETRNDAGRPLHIVHRDVSPQNILVGADGIPRVLDFGIAKAIGHLRLTPSGEIKGKLSYISPEQLEGEGVDRRADIYGASAVLWETLTGRPLFEGSTESAILHGVLHDVIAPPSALQPDCPPLLDAIVMRGLSRDASERFGTAREMAICLERDVGLATQSEVSDWLHALAGRQLAARAEALARMQEGASDAPPLPVPRELETGPHNFEFNESTPTPTDVSGYASEPVPRRSMPFWPWLSFAVALLCTAAWLFAQRAQHSSAETPLVQPAQRASFPQPSAASTASPVAASSPAPAAVFSPGVAPPEVIERGIAPPPPEAHRSQDKARPLRAAARSKPAASIKAQCKPYYYIDELGIRRPKPGCL